MKAVLVGDNLIPAKRWLEASAPLRQVGYRVRALEWLAADREEMIERNLKVEKYGPEAVSPPPELEAEVREAEILIVHFCPVPCRVIEAGERLQVIGVARAGYENIALEAASQRRIPVVHLVGRNASAVAEFALGLMLCEMRHIACSHQALSAGIWYGRRLDITRCRELNGKKVGLVGFGAVGQALARRLRGFEVELLVYDPFVAESIVQEAGGQMVDLETLLKQSDVVSLHARLTPQTQGLIGRRELSLMKPSACLVNTARAGLIDEAALVEALREGRIAGAALDVFWQEPLPPDSPLLALDNVTLTAHLAGSTIDAILKSVDLAIHAVLDYLQNGQRDLVVNTEIFD